MAWEFEAFKIHLNMKNVAIILGLIACIRLSSQSYTSGRTYLQELHHRYERKMCQCYTFSQKNTHYKADTVSGHSEWHEKIDLPDYFRIAFGDTAQHNFVEFKNDSMYSYKLGKFVKSRVDSNSLLLILGGMYYRSFENSIARLKQARFNVEAFRGDTWQNQTVWVIGDTGNNQIYFLKSDGRVVRILEKLNNGDEMDMRFEAYQKWCEGSVETKVSFRRNGRLEQVEEYYNLRKCAAN